MSNERPGRPPRWRLGHVPWLPFALSALALLILFFPVYAPGLPDPVPASVQPPIRISVFVLTVAVVGSLLRDVIRGRGRGRFISGPAVLGLGMTAASAIAVLAAQVVLWSLPPSPETPYIGPELLRLFGVILMTFGAGAYWMSADEPQPPRDDMD